MAGAINAVGSQFSQLKLKGKPVIIHLMAPATDTEISSLFTSAQQVDKSLSIEHLLKADLLKANRYQ